MKADTLYKRIVKSAAEHGRDSEPDHEVGDLQDILYIALQHLEKAGELPDFIDSIRSTVGYDQLEFDWLQKVKT